MIDHLSFVEFLELIGRVADCHLYEMDEPLEVKIGYVLDEWLSLVDMEREESKYFEDGMGGDDSEDNHTASPKQSLIH